MLCPVSWRLLLGGGAEFNEIDDAILMYVLGSAGVKWNVGEAATVTGIANLGWAFSQEEGSSILLEPVAGEVTDLDNSGISVGAGLRFGFAETRSISPFLHVAWRMVLLDKDEYERGRVVRRSSEPVSSFPITVGVRLRL